MDHMRILGSEPSLIFSQTKKKNLVLNKIAILLIAKYLI